METLILLTSFPGGNGGCRGLESVSETNSPIASDVEGEGEEYETADSGVSEQSEEGSTSLPLTMPKKQRKRKLSQTLSGDSGEHTMTTIASDARKRDRDEMSSPSSDDLDYSDAMSGSPPNGAAAGGLRLVNPKSPGKKINAAASIQQPTIRKRKPKTYRSVISDVFDGKLVSTVQCLTCNRVSLTTEAFQVNHETSLFLSLPQIYKIFFSRRICRYPFPPTIPWPLFVTRVKT